MLTKEKKLTKKELEKDNEIFKKINFNGVTPSPKDSRDYKLRTKSLLAATKIAIPEEYKSPSTPILDQGLIGSCVAHSCASALMVGEKIERNTHNDFSRGYIYANRAPSDYPFEGMFLRQALKQLNKCGDVLYEDFPYNDIYEKVKILKEEREEELAEKALPFAIKNYFRCYSEEDIKYTIMTRGSVMITIPVFSDFSRNLKKTKTNELEGYHALLLIGWTKDNRWIVQNSWGESWGYKGKLFMDFDYPVDEYWGLTVNISNDSEDYIKSSPGSNFKAWLKQLWHYILNFFKHLFRKR